MPVEITVPQIGEAVAELLLAMWHKQEGDHVEIGDVLFEIDAEKAVVEVEAFTEGTLIKITAPDGSTVMPMDVVGLIAETGETPSIELTATGEPVTPTHDQISPFPATIAANVSPVAQRVADNLNVDVSQIKGTGLGGRIMADDVRHFAATSAQTTQEASREPEQKHRILASPRARARAEELDVDLHGLTGTGVDGIISVRDVEAAAEVAQKTAVSTVPEVAPDVQPLSNLRQTIATRMLQSKQSVPHFYLMVDVDMTGTQNLREFCRNKLNWDKPPTYTDLIIRACALALAEMPEVNVSFAENDIVRHSAINIGVAVGVDDGLIVPIVKDADRMPLAETTEQVRALSTRARSGRLQANDFGRKSMVVSNLGMYGVDTFVAIIDIPDPMILAVGRVADRVVAEKGQVVIRPSCTMTLSVDHRVLDGVLGAKFLERVKVYLESPFGLLG